MRERRSRLPAPAAVLIAASASVSVVVRAGNSLPSGTAWLVACLAGGIIAFYVPAKLVLTRLLPALLRDAPRRQRWWLVTGSAAGAALLLAVGSLRAPPAPWHFAEPGREHERIGSLAASEWGTSLDAIALHSHVPDNPAFRWRAELSLPRTLRRIGGRIDLRFTQPRAAVLDEQGRPRTDGDGVELRFLLRHPDGTREIAARTLSPIAEPGDRRWHHLRLGVPALTDAVVVEVLPRAFTSHDTVFIHTDCVALPGGFRLALSDWVWLSLLVVTLLAFGLPPQTPVGLLCGGQGEPVRPVEPRVPWRHVAGALVVFLLVATVLVAVYSARERTAIFFWDFSGYWVWCAGLADQLRASPPHALLEVCRSIATQDYNLLAVLPIAPVMLALGDARVVYLLAVAGLYGGVALLSLILASWRLSGLRPPDDRPVIWVATLVVLTTVPFWVPILRGYPDVGGVAITLLALGLYFGGPTWRASLSRLLAIGVLIALLPLFRRWYAYWAVAFLVLVGAEGLVELLRGRGRDRAGLRYPLRPFVTISSSAALVLVALAGPWLRRVGTTNYRNLLSAYRPQHGVVEGLQLVVADWGYLYFGLFVIAVAALIAQRRTRRLGLWLSLHTATVCLLFQATQHFGPQHYYLLQPAALLATTLFLIHILAWLRRGALRVTVAAACLAAGAFLHACIFWPEAGALAAWGGRFLPRGRSYPLSRGDTAELARLLAVLDHELAHVPGPVYVLSSSGILTEDILRNAVRQPPGLRFDSVARVAATAHVDKRDGFPARLLDADLVVVAAPIQYHLSPEHQQVIGIPAESFLAGRDIAGAFERLPAVFRLDAGVTVWVYRKTRPIALEEVRRLSERIGVAYPDDPRVYQPPD